MTAGDLIAALALPAGARVDQRVPKKLLLENGAPTAADRRQVRDGVEELRWVAALEPGTVAVPSWCDEVREILEIHVLRLTLRPGTRARRLVELVHRAVPYPVVLVTEGPAQVGLSLAHERRSQGEAGKTVVDGDVVALDWDVAQESAHGQALRTGLALDRQPRGTLLALYDGWIDTLLAFDAARLTGTFRPVESAAHAARRRVALEEIRRLVAINLDLQRLQADRAAAAERL